jgi:ornithine carbamoyltransferase
MHIALNPIRPEQTDAALPRELELLLALARELHAASSAAPLAGRLKGKNLALLSDSAAGADATLFTRAATALGANVAHITPALNELSASRDVEATAKMLGRLYDAVECQGLPPRLVRQIGLAAGVPVYDGLASWRHATASIASRLNDIGSPPEQRRLLLQAWLVTSVG